MQKGLVLLIFVFLFMIGSCGGEDFSENFPHEHAGLNWSDKSPNKMTWNKAIEYCKGLGGRLPTISELRTLIQNCPATETGGECGLTDSCLSWDNCRDSSCDGCEYDSTGKYSVFGDTGWLWSSSTHWYSTYGVWGVGFNSGHVGDYGKTSDSHVRCVK